MAANQTRRRALPWLSASLLLGLFLLAGCSDHQRTIQVSVTDASGKPVAAKMRVNGLPMDEVDRGSAELQGAFPPGHVLTVEATVADRTYYIRREVTDDNPMAISLQLPWAVAAIDSGDTSRVTVTLEVAVTDSSSKPIEVLSAKLDTTVMDSVSIGVYSLRRSFRSFQKVSLDVLTRDTTVYANVQVSGQDPQVVTILLPRRTTPKGDTLNVPLLATDETWEFAQTTVTEESDNAFDITNTGKKPLKITRMVMSGSDRRFFDLLDKTPISIDPEKTRQIRIRFKPLLPGTLRARLDLTSNDARNPKLGITLAATAMKEQAPDIAGIMRDGANEFNNEQWKAAEDRYSYVLSFDQYNAVAYYMRGRSRAELKDYDRALEDFENAAAYRSHIPRADRERIECDIYYQTAITAVEKSQDPNTQNERTIGEAVRRLQDYLSLEQCGQHSQEAQNAKFWLQKLQGE